MSLSKRLCSVWHDERSNATKSSFFMMIKIKAGAVAGVKIGFS